jgi:nucleoside phosphorylase
MTQRSYPSNQTPQADVLLVTVTEVETMAVRRLFTGVGKHFIGDKTYYDLEDVGGAKVFLVQSEMGSGGQGGTIRTIEKGIDILSPSAVIMVGIAFGVDPKKQRIGDILVSEQILDYDLLRVGSGPDHGSVIVSRGDKAAASPRLLNRFRDGAMEWRQANEPAKVKFGLILSGAKLVDNLDFREQLRAFGPDAIGGEMEGAGLYAAAQGNKVDWILVKAICDWADGSKSGNKQARQELAATNAARFTNSVIKQGGLRSQRLHNSPSAVAIPTNQQGQPQIPSTNPTDGTEPIEVFISYSADDEKFKKQLETHLSQLRREGVIRPWHSQQTKLGEAQGREQEIANHIDSAQIILLLMSPSFIASDQLYENEMMRAINRQQSGNAVRVIPITVRHIAPGDPDKTPFQKIQGLPRNGKPIESWRSADEAWATIAQEIRGVCKDLRANA